MEEKGLLSNSFPNNVQTEKEALLSKLPHSLKDSVEKLLASHPNIKWNEDLQLVYNSTPVTGSNIVDLLTNYIVKSNRLISGSAELGKVLGHLKSVNSVQKRVKRRAKGSENWIRAEDIQHGRGSKVRKTALSVNKNSGRIKRSFWVP